MKIPKGFKELEKAKVFFNEETRQLIVTASPWDVWPDEDPDKSPHHDCDAAGCGWDHVIARCKIIEVD